MSTLRWVGRPSSSIARLPQFGPNVPSSTSVTPRAGDDLADAAGVDRAVLQDVVGLEAVPARLVEQDAAAAALEHDGQRRPTAPAVPASLVMARRAASLGDLLDGCSLEHLEAERVGERLVSPSACRRRPTPRT